MADLASLRWLPAAAGGDQEGGHASAVDGALADLAATAGADDRERVLLTVRLGIQRHLAGAAGDVTALAAAAAGTARWAPPLLDAASDTREGKDCRRLCLDCLASLLAVPAPPASPDARRALADATVVAGLVALAAADAALRTAALRSLAVAAPLAGPARAEAARDALRDYAADPPATVRRAALAGVVRAAARGVRLPDGAAACAVAALADGDPEVRLQGLALLLVTARGEGATMAGPPTRRATAAAASAFAAASSTLGDADARVRAAALRVLGRLAAAPAAVKAGALSKKVTARTMEGKSADDAAVAAAAADSGADWSDAAGAFVHGLEDDAARVRRAALGAMARLGAGDPGFAAAAAELAADCVGDECGRVRAAALRCLCALLVAAGGAASLDAHLGAAAAGLGDAVPAAHAAAASLLARVRPRGAVALAAAAAALLGAAAPDPGAPPDPDAMAALAALGAAAGGAAGPLAPDLLGTRAGFVLRECGVDDARHAARLALLLAAARVAPGVAATLPDHALGAAAVLAGRWQGLGLPAGGARALGRGAVEVARGDGGWGDSGSWLGVDEAAAKHSGGAAADPGDVVGADPGDAAVAGVQAACATLTRLGTAPWTRALAGLRRTDAALAPLADARGPASGAAAAARLHVRALALVAGGRAVLAAGLAPDEMLPLCPAHTARISTVDDPWDGGPFCPPPLSECGHPGLAPDALDAVAAVLRACMRGGGVMAAVAELEALAGVWRVLAGGWRPGRAEGWQAAEDAVRTALDAGCEAPWLAAAAVASARRDAAALRTAAAEAWPAPVLGDPQSIAALDGMLDAPGGPHARPFEATEGLPAGLPVRGRVRWVGGGGGDWGDVAATAATAAGRNSGPLGPRPRTFLRVASPVGPTVCMALTLQAVNSGPKARGSRPWRTLDARDSEDGSSSDAGGSDGDEAACQADPARVARQPPREFTFSGSVDLPAAPDMPDVGLWASLVVDAGRGAHVRLAPGQALRVRAGAAGNAHAAAAAGS